MTTESVQSRRRLAEISRYPLVATSRRCRITVSPHRRHLRAAGPHAASAADRYRERKRAENYINLYPPKNGRKAKGKVFPYSLPSVGPGADPGVQAVSPQVT